jgi:hypothetical protein
VRMVYRGGCRTMLAVFGSSALAALLRMLPVNGNEALDLLR